MNEFSDLYAVERQFYKSFVEQLKPSSYRVEEIDIGYSSTAIKLFSVKTGKCLCSRVFFKDNIDDKERQPEQYYIFEMPDDDERQAPIPKYRLELKSREEVQAFLNVISKLQKEQEKKQ